MKENSKQVIIIRKDLNMRTGKMISQGAHSSISFLTKEGFITQDHCLPHNHVFENCDLWEKYEVIDHWLQNSFRKIVCYVNSEEELIELHRKALDKGMLSHLIEDNGATEFNGVKTLTALAVGPDWDEEFEGLTNHLPLL